MIIKKSFDELIERGYGYNFKEVVTCPNWHTLRELYRNNYTNNFPNEKKIPKKIHQIWIGGTLPSAYKKYTESWKNFNPDYDYQLWTDSEIKTFDFRTKSIFEKTINLGSKSDILRYAILEEFGGVYVDTDFECIKPIDDFLNLDFFTSISYDTKVQLYIAIIGSIPNHPILKHINDNIRPVPVNKVNQIMNGTGANFFTKFFFDCVDKTSKNIVAFPMDYFYPYPNNVRGNDNPYQFLQDCSYAIHHWEVSWIKKL